MITTKKTFALAALLTAILLPLGTVGIAEAGNGSSSSSNAKIDLYDNGSRQAGQTLSLSDSYSGCLGANAGSFSATVYSDKTTITWDANSTYYHSCLFGHQFNGGEIKHEGQTYNIPSSDTSGSHDFNNSGSSPYSVDVEFYYN